MSKIQELDLKTVSQKAKEASYKLASLSNEIKNKALLKIAENIEKNKNLILEENKKTLIKLK